MPEPVVTKEQVQGAPHHFTPASGLPVVIDFADRVNPYELSQEVVYDNGIVRVLLEKGFKWDGASIPIWIPLVPWVLTVAVLQVWSNQWVLAVTAALVVYAIRLLPYMQKMGLHSRACCVHDKLCRAQKVSRVVADSIMLEIMEQDGVPWDVRWIIYGRVRNFGWIAWIKNRRALRAKNNAAMEAAKDVKVTEP